MGELTNKLNLPQAFVDAVAADTYDPGSSDITVTQLISPPRMVALRGKHREEITEDASDRVWNLMGQITHGILERANKIDLAETRLYVDVLGWKVGGQFDSLILENAQLNDWKVTTVWKFSKKDAPPPREYVEQLNILAFILSQNNIKVNSLRIVAILRDWSKPEAKRNADYPQTNVLSVDIPFWEEEVTRKFIEERVRLHQEARKLVEGGKEPPLCTEEERWVKPTKYATKKKDAKRATKLYDTYEEAERNLGHGMIVEVREGENTRCLMYCAASKWCSFAAPLLEENSLEGIEFPQSSVGQARFEPPSQ